MKGNNTLILLVVGLVIAGLAAAATAQLPTDENIDTAGKMDGGPGPGMGGAPPEQQGPPPGGMGGPMGMKSGGPGGPMGGTGRPGGQMGGPGGPSDKGNAKVSNEQIKSFESWLKTEDPDKYSEIQEMKSNNPEIYKRIVFEGVRHYSFLKMMQKKDPESYQRLLKEMKLDGKLRRLSKEYRDSKDEAKKKELKAQMKPVVEQLFDIRTQNREREVKEISKKVKQLQEMIQKRKTNKNTIIERKLQEVTGEMQGMEW